ncbi:MAG: hypothetical protein CFE21_10395 [Bacteroidetes bacterium B1(2017)]|nr:MAG: hypothetical protein CFE21_10395 [Bacteroidetes bacterium B1(2017)]
MKTILIGVAPLLILILLLAINPSQAQIIQTVAGGIGEGALPQNYNIAGDCELIIDKKGNIYFFDGLYFQIKKIDASTGRIKTIAGKGNWGDADDNDSALNAEIFDVTAMGLDSVGNLYFSGTNNLIRKVNISTGIISTIAGNGTNGYTPDGNLANGFAIGLVKGIVFDKSGNMYFLENNMARKVDKSTGLLTTIAGTGAIDGALGDGGLATAATLNTPRALIMDDSSNIFIADGYQYRIRKVSTLTGIISTIVGNGTSGYSGDSGLATNASIGFINSITFDGIGNLILSDNNSVIRKVTKQTGIITTLAGKGIFGFGGDGGLAVNALLGTPGSIDKDSLGNIIFSDYYNKRVRKINTSGVISTLMGNGTQGFIGLGEQAIYAQLFYASSIFIDSEKNIFTTNSNRICKINAQTGILTAFAGTGEIGFSGDNGPASSAKFNNPAGLLMDKAGNFIFIDYGNFRIRKINASTLVVTTIAGTGKQGYSGDGGLAIEANIGAITSMDIDSAGNLYICDAAGTWSDDNRIRKISAATGIITTYAGGDIKGFSGDGGPVSSAVFYYPSLVRVDKKDNIYILDNNRIRKVDAKTGIIQTVLGGGNAPKITDGSKALEVQYNFGNILEIDDNQNLYISSSGSAIMFKVDSKTGVITNYAGTGVVGFSGDGLAPTLAKLYWNIYDIKFDQLGNAWIIDGNRIRKITNTAPTVLSQPKSIIACLNTKVSFQIKASCDSAYQWQIYQGGVYSNIQNNNIFSGAQTNTLQISILDSSLNNDSFRCVVYGPLGITNSNNGVLKIRPEQSKPQISGPIIACQDQSAVYSVPNLSDHTYLWKITGGSLIGSITKNSASAFWSLNKQDTITVFDTIYGTKCGVSVSQIVSLKPKPSPAFTYTQAGGKLTFFPVQLGMMSYSWEINKITSNDLNPKVQFTTNGIYRAYLKVTDSLNCYKDTSIDIQVSTVGLDQYLKEANGLKVYPNPVKNFLTIEFNNPIEEYNLSVLDITGRVILANDKLKDRIYQLNLEALPSACYFVQVSTPSFSKVMKVFKD